MTAEELLNEYDSMAVEPSEYCIIDPDTREIEIPFKYQRLGVESDEKTNRIKFQCPKIVGNGTDLSQYQLRINYQNANPDISNNKDQYIVTDVETEGDNITFSWILSRKVTAYKGTISFIVCAVNVSGATITNEWNTTLAHSEVLEGLEVDTPQPSEEESDVIAQLLQIVKDTSDSAVLAVQEAEQKAIDKISAIPTVTNHIISFGKGE